MLFYYILLALVVATSFCVRYARDPFVVSTCKAITLLLLIIPAALRYGIGVDYLSYENIFYEIKHGGGEYIEPGYYCVNKVVAAFGGGPQWVFALMAFFTVYFFFKGVSKDRWLIYTVGFVLIAYTWLFTTVRQVFAAALAFYAWRELNKHKPGRAILAVLIAYTFHYSSFIYPVLYFLSKIRISQRTIIVISVCGFVLFYLYGSLISDQIGGLLLLLGTKYASYSESDWFQSTASMGYLSSGYGVMLRYLGYFLMLFNYRPDRNKDGMAPLLVFLFYILSDFISIQITIFGRITRGLIFASLPILYNISRPQKEQNLVGVIIVWMIFILLFNMDASVPYVSIFNK